MRHIVAHVRDLDFGCGFPKFSGIVLVPLDGRCKSEANRELYPLTSKNKSVRIGGIRGMKTSLTFAQPVRIVASVR